MTKKISFPKNFERYIELGQEAMDKKNLLAAIRYFEEAYAIKQDFPLNFLLASTYLEIGENQRALDVASEMKEEYVSCLDYMELYVQILIQNNKFIAAHRMINNRILMKQQGEMNRLISMKKKVRKIELMYQQFEINKIKEIKTELKELRNHNYYEQLAIVKKAVHLPQDDFIAIGKEILLDKEVHSLVRSWVLEEFANLCLKEEVEFVWRDQKVYKIVPAEVGGPLDNAAFQRIYLFLEKELMNEDPILLLDLSEEIRLHFALLYPLADEIIKDPQLWAVSYIAAYNESYAKKYDINEKQEDLKKIQQFLYNIRFDLEEMMI